MADLTWTYTITGSQEIDDAIKELAELTGSDAAVHAHAELSKIPELLKRTLDVTAQEAKDTATYQNRTGRLRASTYAGNVQVDGAKISCDMGAHAEYASYVEGRGFSHLEKLAKQAEDRVDAELRRLCDRAAK